MMMGVDVMERKTSNGRSPFNCYSMKERMWIRNRSLADTQILTSTGLKGEVRKTGLQLGADIAPRPLDVFSLW